MRKRLLTSAVLATTASLVLASSTGAALDNIDITDDEFTPKVAYGEDGFPSWQFQWDWNGFETENTAHKHNVVQNKGLFKSGAPTKDGTSEFLIRASAGKYPYHCQIHGDEGMTGKIKQPPALAKSKRGPENTFRVLWATAKTQTGSRFDVRFRSFETDTPPSGAWKKWKENTRKRGAVFGRNGKPVVVNSDSTTYQFQARSQKRKESKRSSWSPKLNVEFN